jgi:hypothetical protein
MREWNSDDYSTYLARFTECNSSRTAEVSVAEKIILQRSRFHPFHPYSHPGPVARDVADALIDEWQTEAHIFADASQVYSYDLDGRFKILQSL